MKSGARFNKSASRAEIRMNLKHTTCRWVVLSLLMSLQSVAGFGQDQQSNSQDSDASNRLVEILQKAGERIQKYTDDILSVVCTEVTQQQELQPDLKTPKNKPTDLVYDFIIARPSSGTGLRELREMKSINGKPASKNANASFPDPTAYTTTALMLLPRARENYTFSYAGTVDLDGRNVLAVDFVPANRRASTVVWERQFFRMSFQSRGRIWIDPISYDVLRIDTHLIEPFESGSPRTVRKGPFVLFGPSRQFKVEMWDVAIRFGLVQFQDPDQKLWLPASVESLRVIQGSRIPRLRTTHTFTNYRRFTSQIKIQ